MRSERSPAGPRLPEILRIHHVGIVVRDAEQAAATYQAGLGLEALAFEEVRGAVRVALLRAGDAQLQLIQPLREDTLWAAALRDRGEGIHHCALEVADLRDAVAAVTAAGVRVLDPHPRRDAGGVLAVFLDPAATGGPLIELVQRIRSAQGGAAR